MCILHNSTLFMSLHETEEAWERSTSVLQQQYPLPLLLPQDWTTNRQLVRCRLATASGKGWVSRYWWLYACQCLGNYWKSWFYPCQGKQRCPMNGLALAYSNDPALLGIGKPSSCLKDPKGVWPTCLFINFLLCFVTASRCNKYHSVEEKQGIDTLGRRSAWIYKNLLWFGSLDVP